MAAHARVPRVFPRLRAAVLGGSLVLAGCYWITPYEDLTDGAGADASVVDVVVPETGTEQDAPAPRGFCASLEPAPAFCDDFEDASLGGWQTRVTPPDILRVDAVRAASAPNALYVEVPDGSTTSDDAYVERALGEGSDVELAFDLFLERSTSNTDPIFLARISAGQSNADLWGLPGVANIVETTPKSAGSTDFSVLSHGVGWKPRFGAGTAWVHVTMRLAVRTSGSSLDVDVDGTTTTIPLAATWQANRLRVRIGFVHVNAPPSPRAVRYDNVTIR